SPASRTCAVTGGMRRSGRPAPAPGPTGTGSRGRASPGAGSPGQASPGPSSPGRESPAAVAAGLHAPGVPSLRSGSPGTGAPVAAPTTALNLPWPVGAAAFAASEVLVVHVQRQRDAHTFSISDLVLAAGLYLAAPGALVTALVVGAGAALLLHRRQTGLRLAF